MKRVISQSLGLDLVNINVYAIVYQNIPLSSRDRAIFLFFRIWISATPRPIPNDILTISWATSCQYQCVCKILSKYSKRFKSYRHFFTNRPRTKFLQTSRGQNFHKLSDDKIKCLIIGHECGAWSWRDMYMTVSEFCRCPPSGKPWEQLPGRHSHRQSHGRCSLFFKKTPQWCQNCR